MTEKEQNITETGELLTEPYDNNIKMTRDENAFSLFAGQKQVAVRYQLTADEVKCGLLRFQKKTVYKKNWLYTALLGIIFVLYSVNIIRNPQDGLSYFLAILSLAVIAFVWLTPYTHRRKMAKAVTETAESFLFTVCEKGLIAGEDENASYIFYEGEPVEVYAYPDMLIFNISKEKIFILPRRCADDESWAEAILLLKTGLGEERFTELEK